MSSIADWAAYLLYSLLWRVARLLPESFAYLVFRKIAIRSYRKNGRRVQRLRNNYRVVRPGASESEIENLVQLGLFSAMRYWCDTFRISDWDWQRVASTVTTTNHDIFKNSVDSGRGVIVALPHAGNWDHAGLYYCTLGIRVNTVAEHLRPERLFRRFLAHRERMGMNVLDLDAGVTDQLIELLNSGELVALVADRDLSRSGIDVSFFGANARFPAGPALLAQRTNADLLTAYVSFTESGIHIKFSGPIQVHRNIEGSQEVRRLTQLIADQFASDIAGDLTSWHMQQRIFIEALEERS